MYRHIYTKYSIINFLGHEFPCVKREITMKQKREITMKQRRKKPQQNFTDEYYVFFETNTVLCVIKITNKDGR